MKILDYLEEILICLSLAIAVVVNFGNVISRYFLHASWSFSEEIMVSFFVYNTFFGVSEAFKRGTHLGFTVLLDYSPIKVRKVLILVIHVFSAILIYLLLRYGIQMVFEEIRYNQTTPALGLPAWLQTLSVPLGSLLIMVRLFQSYKNEIHKLNVNLTKDSVFQEVNS